MKTVLRRFAFVALGLAVYVFARGVASGLANRDVRRIVLAGLRDDFSLDYWPSNSEAAIEAVSRDHSRSADEALVIVSGCYYGEHNGEMIAVSVESRGMRMLPLITKYERRKWYQYPCVWPVGDNLGAAQEAILKGEHWNE